MFNSSFLLNYLSQAPLSLAFERFIECNILKTKNFQRPILDIGCGEGLFASILFTQKIDVGIDPQKRELARAYELGAYDKLIQCFGDDISYPDSSFKTIFSNSVLEHIEDLRPVLIEAHRVLSDDGTLFVTIPSDKFERYSVICTLLDTLRLRSLSYKFRNFYNHFWAHYHAYSLHEWRDLFCECGFTITESFSYAPHWLCFLNDLLVPTAIFDKLMKKYLNRWTLFKPLRTILTFPIFLISSLFLRFGGKCKDGGLVFISAKRA